MSWILWMWIWRYKPCKGSVSMPWLLKCCPGQQLMNRLIWRHLLSIPISIRMPRMMKAIRRMWESMDGHWRRMPTAHRVQEPLLVILGCTRPVTLAMMLIIFLRLRIIVRLSVRNPKCLPRVSMDYLPVPIVWKLLRSWTMNGTRWGFTHRRTVWR